MKPLRLVAVVGPTASGKSSLALELAQFLKARILSADSRQIYRWMDIGTAKPDKSTLAQVPHYLIDIKNPDEPYSAGDFAQDAREIIAELNNSKIPLVLAGGTGLYIKALDQGIIKVPDIQQNFKDEVQNLITQKGLAGAYAVLQELDPLSAKRLHPNDIARITRALEVVIGTGKTIHYFQKSQESFLPKIEFFYIGVQWERETLYHRINQRVIDMVQDGLIDETEKLIEMGYHKALGPMRSIGYRQVLDYLEGKLSKEEMILEIQKKTRHYAKKQITWYRDFTQIHWSKPDQSRDKIFEQAKSFLEG